eukprot:s1076_g17.t1
MHVLEAKDVLYLQLEVDELFQALAGVKDAVHWPDFRSLFASLEPTLREEQLEHLWRCFDTELGVVTCGHECCEGDFNSPDSFSYFGPDSKPTKKRIFRAPLFREAAFLTAMDDIADLWPGDTGNSDTKEFTLQYIWRRCRVARGCQGASAGA